MRLNTVIVVATLVLAGLTLTACASGARSSQMIATGLGSTSLKPGQSGYMSVALAPATGGSSTNPLWRSNVSSEEFGSALRSSLELAGMLAPVEADAKYRVTAQLLNLDRPLGGFDLTVGSRVQYKVVEANSGQAVFDKPVAAKGTAKVGDALIAVERLRLANEASVKVNIETFIQRFQAVLRGEP